MRLLPLVLVGLSMTCVSFAVPVDETLNQEWQDFKTKFEKSYADVKQEEQARNYWEKVYTEVKQHNKEYKLGLHSWSKRVHGRADKDPKDVGSCRRNNPDIDNHVAPCTFTPALNNVDSAMNWTYLFPPVQNQGECESCWAYSTGATMSAHYFKHFNVQKVFSIQELIDCVLANNGCCTGWMNNAYQYMMDHGVREQEYYEPIQDESPDGCKPDDPSEEEYKIVNYVGIAQGRDDLLVSAIYERGPITVALDPAGFDTYKDGVLDAPCTQDPNHALAVVGYGTWTDPTSGQQTNYWLIRNSWGIDVDEYGYVKLTREVVNKCGISNYASFPTFDSTYCPAGSSVKDRAPF